MVKRQNLEHPGNPTDIQNLGQQAVGYSALIPTVSIMRPPDSMGVSFGSLATNRAIVLGSEGAFKPQGPGESLTLRPWKNIVERNTDLLE